MSAPASPAAPWMGLPWLARANLLVLGIFGLLLCRLLWPAWRHDPDVSHGLFMPLVFLFLLHHGRTAGPARYLAGGARSTGAALVLALGGIGLIAVAGLYAAALGWSNALVDFLFAAAFSFLLLAALIAFADRRLRWMPWNWTTVMAAALWPLAAPIPPGTYTRLTIALQLWVSSAVMPALHLLGILAMRQGNVIQLSNTSVGVEEACSGVRSLVSCVFVGLFFSAGLVSRPRARALIIALSAPLALGMNFIRSLTLTLLANAGIQIEGFWHDATGFAVLGVTIVILGGIAILVGGRVPTTPFPPDGEIPPPPPGTPANKSPRSQRLIAAAAALSALLILVFYVNTRAAVRRDVPVPNLLSFLPDSPSGWNVTTRADLYQFQGVLQTDVLAERTYRRVGAAGPETITLYLAYWRPGQAPVSLVATHTPDACWPGSGWVSQPQAEARVHPFVNGREIPDGESRVFTNAGYARHVWFWQLYDGRPIPYLSPHSLGPLLRIAWHYGFRHEGDQLFIRISSNQSWAEIGDDPLLRDFFSRLRPFGL